MANLTTDLPEGDPDDPEEELALPTGEQRDCLVPPAAAGVRLDRHLAEVWPDLSRSRLQDLIREGHVSVAGRPVSKPRQALAAGDSVVVRIPVPSVADIVAQDIPLRVLYEDASLIVLDKTAGLVVHPAAGHADGTLVNALLHHCRGQLSGIGGVGRPGIVHRLDRDTSGCLVAAKTDAAHHSLSKQFADRETQKVYLCVIAGVPPQRTGRIENHLGRHPVNRQRMAVVRPESGKSAVTGYEILHSDPGGRWALVECALHTGRTHQIRVHMREGLHHAILGDEIYAQPQRQTVAVSRLMLHAWRLGFRHPISGERMSFRSEIPEAFHPFLPPGGVEAMEIRGA